MINNIFPEDTKKWASKLSKYISAQLLVQFFGLACGILLIRNLSKQEYAYFTLANSLQGSMNVLASSGIISALSAIGGKVWQDPFRFSQLVSTAMRLRLRLATVSAAAVSPILLFLLLKNGASLGYSLFLIVGILIELALYLRNSIWQVVLQLNTKINQIQKVELLGSGSRLALLAISNTILSAGLGVFISTLASGFQYTALKKQVKDLLNSKASIHKEDHREIKRLILLQLPSSLFFCIQGQLTVILISFFGNTQNIAEIGALSRLAVIFSLIMSIMTNIVLPSFARCQSKYELRKRYFQILAAYAGFSGILIFLIATFPSKFLFVLGSQYSNLEQEIILMAVSQTVTALSTVLWNINSTKGWIELSWLFPPAIILTQIALLLFLDISTVRGVIIFSTLSIMPASCLNFVMTYKGMKTISG